MLTSENCTIGIPDAALAQPPCFILQLMRSMISTYSTVILPLLNALRKASRSASGLYSRVAFDARSLRSIVFIREHEMSHNRLACNIFILTKELQLLSRSNVSDMEMRPAFLSQLHRQTAALHSKPPRCVFPDDVLRQVILTPFLP